MQAGAVSWGGPRHHTETFEYRIVVTNTNVTYTQANVIISDTVPVSTTLAAGSVACSPGAICCESGGVVTATASSLGPGDVLTLTFGVTVNEGVTSIGGNIAAVESDSQSEQITKPVYPPSGKTYFYLPLVMRDSSDRARDALLPISTPPLGRFLEGSGEHKSRGFPKAPAFLL